MKITFFYGGNALYSRESCLKRHVVAINYRKSHMFQKLYYFTILFSVLLTSFHDKFPLISLYVFAYIYLRNKTVYFDMIHLLFVLAVRAAFYVNLKIH